MHLGTRELTLTVGGVERTADVSDCRIVSASIEGFPLQTWQEGSRLLDVRRYRLQGTAAQEMGAGSLWDLAWSNAGSLVEIDLRPAGGEVASDSQPWFTGQVFIVEPDGDFLGGAANASRGTKFTFTFDWPFLTRPVRVDGSGTW